MEIGIGNFIGICVLLLLVGFVTGWLVTRNNAKRFEELAIKAAQELAAIKRKAGLK